MEKLRNISLFVQRMLFWNPPMERSVVKWKSQKVVNQPQLRQAPASHQLKHQETDAARRLMLQLLLAGKDLPCMRDRHSYTERKMILLLQSLVQFNH